jgi:hypothetical protein
MSFQDTYAGVVQRKNSRDNGSRVLKLRRGSDSIFVGAARRGGALELDYQI